MGGGDDVHANAASVFCFFCCVTCRDFSNAAGCSVRPLLPLLIASLLKRRPCKNLAFLQLSRQNFENDAKNQLKKTRKTWYLRHFRKNATKTQEQKT